MEKVEKCSNPFPPKISSTNLNLLQDLARIKDNRLLEKLSSLGADISVGNYVSSRVINAFDAFKVRYTCYSPLSSFCLVAQLTTKSRKELKLSRNAIVPAICLSILIDYIVIVVILFAFPPSSFLFLFNP